MDDSSHGVNLVLLSDSWQYLNPCRQEFRITVIFPPTLSTAGYGTGGARITDLDTFFVECTLKNMGTFCPNEGTLRGSRPEGFLG